MRGFPCQEIVISSPAAARATKDENRALASRTGTTVFSEQTRRSDFCFFSSFMKHMKPHVTSNIKHKAVRSSRQSPNLAYPYWYSLFSSTASLAA